METLHDEIATGKRAPLSIDHVMSKLVEYAERNPSANLNNVVAAASAERDQRVARHSEKHNLTYDEQVNRAKGFNARLWQRNTIQRKSKSCNSKNFVFASVVGLDHAIGFNANPTNIIQKHCSDLTDRLSMLSEADVLRLAVLHNMTQKMKVGEYKDIKQFRKTLYNVVCCDCLGKKH